MPTDLQTILRMRKPKGRHVGAAMLLNLVNDYINAGIPHEPLFSQDKLAKMVASFSSDIDLNVYANYADIIAGAEHLFDYTEYCIQQVMHGFYRLNSVTAELSTALKLRFAAKNSGLGDLSLKPFLSITRSPSEIVTCDNDREFIKISYQNLIFQGMRGMLAFDAFMSVIAQVTGVSEVSEIKSRSQYALETISFLNNISYDDFAEVEGEALGSLFPPIDTQSLNPDAIKTEELKSHLSCINTERCPSLKRLKSLMLGLRGGGEAP